MKNKIFSFIAIANMLLASSTTIIAANDSTISAKDVVVQKVENARKKTHDVKDFIDEQLNDTIINTHDIAINHSSNELIQYHNNRVDAELEVIEEAMSFVERLGIGFTILIAIIIILVILGNYISRRQKYKIIEKAIENNYPLPPGFITNNMRPSQTTIQHIHYSSVNDQNANTTKSHIKKTSKEFNVSDWGNFHSGIKWCAWGIALIIFFLLIDAPFWPFAIIPIITGLGKLYTAYRLNIAESNATSSTTIVDNDTLTPPAFPSNPNHQS